MLLCISNTHNVVNYSIIIENRICLKEKNGNACLLYSPRASVTWAAVTSSRPEQAWVPGLGCPQTPDPGRPSHSYCKPTAPQNWWTLWAWRAMNSHSLVSPGGGVSTPSLPPQSPSTNLWQKAKHFSRIKVWLESEGKGRWSSEIQALGCFSGTLHSNLQSRNPSFFH